MDDIEQYSCLVEDYQENREHIQEAVDDVEVWVDQNDNVISWEDLEYYHLENIVFFLRTGKSENGQRHKLSRAKAELQRRVSEEVFNAKY